MRGKSLKVLSFFKENFNKYRKLSFLYILLVVGIIVLPLNFFSKVFLVLSISNFIFCFFYFKNIFNLPGILITMFFLQIGCSQAKLTSVEQDDFHFMTWLTLFTVVLIFYFCSFYVFKLANKAVSNETIDNVYFYRRRLFLSNLIFLAFEVIIYLYVYVKLGSIPAFNDEIRAFLLPQLVGNLGMTVLSLPLFFIIINSVYCIIEKRYSLMLLNLIYVVLLITLGSRICIFISTVTVLFFALITMYFKTNRKKEMLLLCVSIFSIVSLLMVSIPLIRTQIYIPDSGEKKIQISSGNSYYSSIYYDKKDFRDSEEENSKSSLEIPSVFLPIWVNFSTEMHGFNGIVENLFITGNYKYGKMFLTGPFNFITKYFFEKPDYSDALKISWINVCTFLQEPYLDFGIFGVALFTFIFSTCGMVLYVMAIKKKSLFTMVYYSYIAMCTVFFIFANHFYYSTFIINTSLLYILIKLFTNDKISIKRKKHEIIK